MKKYLKYIVIYLAIVLVVSALASGCGGKTEAPANISGSPPWEKWPPTQVPADWNWPNPVVVGGASGYRYSQGVGMGEILKKYAGINVQAIQGPGGVAGSKAILSKQYQVTEVEGVGLVDPFYGTGAFSQTEGGQLRMLLNGTVVRATGLWVRKDSGIKSPADLRGKKVGLAPGLPVFYLTGVAILKGYGIGMNEIYQVPFVEVNEIPTLLSEGRVDAVAYAFWDGTIQQQLMASGKVFPMGVDESKINAILAQVPEFTRTVLPAGSYKGQDTDILSTGTVRALYVHKDFPDTLGYTISRVMLEHTDEWATYTPEAKSYDISKGLPAQLLQILMNDGSKRYLKEKGLWTAEHDKAEQKMLARLKK